MTATRKQTLARQYWHYLSTGKVDAALAMYAPGATFTSRASGAVPVTALAAPMRAVFGSALLRFTFDRMIEEGDDLVIFGHGSANFGPGLDYKNQYCWFVQFDGDLLTNVSEYCDTAYSQAQLFPNLPADVVAALQPAH